MKFTIASGKLQNRLQIVSKIINSKNAQTVPVLANILFEIENGILTLSSADLYNRLTTKIELQDTEAKGAFMVPCRTILEFLKDLPDQPITLEVKPEENYLARLQYNNGHFEFTASDADTFPADIDLQAEKDSVELEATNVLAGITATKFATSKDDRRPIMTGVLMDFKSDALVYVASDGRYLVRYTDNRVKSSKEAQICIPSPICTLIADTLLPKEEGNIRLSYDSKHLQVELSEFTLTARLLEGKFPNYNSVIPPSSPFDIIVNRDSLLFGSKRVASCANKASNLILLAISNNEITLQSKDLDFSIAGQEIIPCSVNNPQHNIRIGFDSELLGEILKSLKSPDVILSLADQTRAGVIRPTEQTPGTETLCLLIPQKLLNE